MTARKIFKVRSKELSGEIWPSFGAAVIGLGVITTDGGGGGGDGGMTMGGGGEI